VSRVPKLTRRYLRSAERLAVVPGSARGRAVGQVIAALAADATLPAPGDMRALIPPTGSAFVRRIPGRNLWLWYTLSEDAVTVIALTADPPVPADE
jgi:hypothetical protein